MTSDLTEKQRRFVEAYMGRAEGNATEAARIAGYAGDENTLSTAGSRLLRNDKVAAAIRERVVNDPLVADRREIQQWLSDVVRGDVKDGDADAALRERLKAADLLNKTQGNYTENIDVTSKGKRLGNGFMSREEAQAILASIKADTDDADE